MMAKHKKQHFVPACYLKAWCDPAAPKGHEPYVWRFDSAGKEGRKKAPENIFCETDFYTDTGPAGERLLGLEVALSQIENLFTRVRTRTLNYRKPLTAEDRDTLCIFAAAAHARTPSQRDHLRSQWKRPLEMMDDLEREMKNATPEKRRRFASMAPPSSGNSRRHGSLTQEDVRRIVDAPIQTLMAPMIRTVAPLLRRLDLAILETDDSVGFITSDDPCVWSDHHAYKRPPMYRSPALMYETIEITLPISPRQCLLLNRNGLSGYLPIDGRAVDEVNRITRFGADEYFVARLPQTRPIWFDPGVEPVDSWEKTHPVQATPPDVGLTR